MSKRDFTPKQLKPFDGTKSDDNPEGRILIGVLGKVYDMTKGNTFYGPGKFMNVHFYDQIPNGMKPKLRKLDIELIYKYLQAVLIQFLLAGMLQERWPHAKYMQCMKIMMISPISHRVN